MLIIERLKEEKRLIMFPAFHFTSFLDERMVALHGSFFETYFHGTSSQWVSLRATGFKKDCSSHFRPAVNFDLIQRATYFKSKSKHSISDP